MNRIQLINHLIEQHGFKWYLEVTTHGLNETFSHINCPHKSTTFPASSDTYFFSNRATFDIIFIDGEHTEKQVLKDIRNSLRILNEGGVIVLHDCMPPDAWHQREEEEYIKGQNWNGAVWKAALNFFNESMFNCTLLDTDWGLGIIDTSGTQVSRNICLPEKLSYHEHYPFLLQYKRSVAAYFREHVQVFYHLACMGNWKQVLEEQLLQLKRHGFSNLFMTVLGTDQDLLTVYDQCKELAVAVKKIVHAPELTHFEKPALVAIEQYARHNTGYVLYLHSKGVSNPADETKIKWRRLMMKELVENWEFCVMQLLHYDVVGVNWRDMPPTSHFSGNFWYASTSYLRTLADFNYYFDHPLYQIWDNINYKRLGCEFWISSGSRQPRVLSLVWRNVDFCNPLFWRHTNNQ